MTRSLSLPRAAAGGDSGQPRTGVARASNNQAVADLAPRVIRSSVPRRGFARHYDESVLREAAISVVKPLRRNPSRWDGRRRGAQILEEEMCGHAPMSS